jgi:hypothetical protein
MRIDHHDVTFGRKLGNAVKDQRHRGRLAGAGASKHREMLRQHRIDVERAADVVGRVDGSDFDIGAVVRCEHRAKVLGADGMNLAARDRVAGNAAAEVAHSAGAVAAALAKEIDEGADLIVVIGGKGSDVGNQPGFADRHFHLAADLPRHCDRGVGMALKRQKRVALHPDLRARACDRDHLPDRVELLWSLPRRCLSLLAKLLTSSMN